MADGDFCQFKVVFSFTTLEEIVSAQGDLWPHQVLLDDRRCHLGQILLRCLPLCVGRRLLLLQRVGLFPQGTPPRPGALMALQTSAGMMRQMLRSQRFLIRMMIMLQDCTQRMFRRGVQ